MRDLWICQRFQRRKAANCLGHSASPLSWTLLVTLLLVSGMNGAQAQPWADEDRDWGVAPVASLRQPPYSAPTPMSITGARTVTTADLKTLLESPPAPLQV